MGRKGKIPRDTFYHIMTEMGDPLRAADAKEMINLFGALDPETDEVIPELTGVGLPLTSSGERSDVVLFAASPMHGVALDVID